MRKGERMVEGKKCRERKEGARGGKERRREEKEGGRNIFSKFAPGFRLEKSAVLCLH